MGLDWELLLFPLVPTEASAAQSDPGILSQSAWPTHQRDTSTPHTNYQRKTLEGMMVADASFDFYEFYIQQVIDRDRL